MKYIAIILLVVPYFSYAYCEKEKAAARIEVAYLKQLKAYKKQIDRALQGQKEITESNYRVLKSLKPAIAPIVKNPKSLGEIIFDAAFSVGTPNYIQNKKEAAQRAQIARNNALIEYQKVDNIWRSSQKQELDFMKQRLSIMEQLREAKLSFNKKYMRYKNCKRVYKIRRIK